MTDATEKDALKQEPQGLIERLRYWGHSKSRVRRGLDTGRMQDALNAAADTLEVQQSSLESCQEERKRLRAALFDAVTLDLRRDSKEIDDITFDDAFGIAYPKLPSKGAKDND